MTATARTNSPQGDGAAMLLSGRIPSLDGLRAVAILLVVWGHVHLTRGFPGHPLFHALAHYSAFGVEVFFVLSGFLITTLMLREIARTQRLDARSFYVRRAVRILPAYVAFLAFAGVLTRFRVFQFRSIDWLAACTYTVNFLGHPTWQIGHLWSLSIEEHFYLLWPLVMLAGVGRAKVAACLAIVAAFGARWAILLGAPSLASSAESWTFTRIDSIAFGCALAILVSDERWRRRIDSVCASNTALVGLGLVLAASLTSSSFSGKLSVGFGYTVNGVVISLLVWAAVRRERSLPGRLLNSRWVSAVGVGSYSLYLWQQVFLNRRESGFPYQFPANLIFAAAAAFLSYRLIEKPFLSMKHHFEALAAGKRAVAKVGGRSAADGAAPGPVPPCAGGAVFE